MNSGRRGRGLKGGGFTVVETLVAAGLIGLGFLAISNLFPTGYSSITYGGRITTAVAFAQQKIEALQAIAASTDADKGFNGVNTSPGRCPTAAETLVDPFVPTITYTRTCTLTTNVGLPPIASDLKKVRVTVTWTAENRPGSVQMEELFTR
jgi:Tfp pilus assembly protein PilV